MGDRSATAARLITCAFLLLSLISVARSYLPPAVTGCPRNSTNLNQCIADKIEQLRPNLISGDYGNGTVLETIEPIEVEHIVIDDGRNVRVVFSDLTCAGASNFILEKVSANLKERRVSVMLTVPLMEIVGKYSMKLSISVLKINGKGKVAMKLSDVIITFRFRYDTDGKEKLLVHPVESKVRFEGKTVFNMTDLFKGNPGLSAAANQAINDNPEVILEAAKPVSDRFITDMFSKLATGLLMDAREDEIFSV